MNGVGAAIKMHAIHMHTTYVHFKIKLHGSWAVLVLRSTRSTK